MIKQLLCFASLSIVLVACSNKASTVNGANSSASSALVLNSGCKTLVADTGLLTVLSQCIGDTEWLPPNIPRCNLDSLKTHLSACATTNTSAYAAKGLPVATNIFSNMNFAGNDSVIIYLLANGADSMGRVYRGGIEDYGLLGNAMYARDTMLVNYLLAHQYPAEPSDITFAIAQNKQVWYDSLMARSLNLDSALWVGGAPVITGIIQSYETSVGANSYVLPYFYDLLSHKINVDRTDQRVMCNNFPTVRAGLSALGWSAFNVASMDSLLLPMVKALVAAGANPHLQMCINAGADTLTTPQKLAHQFNYNRIASYLDSLPN